MLVHKGYVPISKDKADLDQQTMIKIHALHIPALAYYSLYLSSRGSIVIRPRYCLLVNKYFLR